jgi:hypothetical protein
MTRKHCNSWTAVFLTFLLMGAVAGCDGNSPTTPAPTPTTQPAGPVTYNIAVRVTDATSGNGLAAAEVVVLDGQFAGSTHTVGDDGTITLTGAQGNLNMEATHTGYRKARNGVGACGSTGCTATIDFALQRGNPWRRQGTGANVFDMPTDLRRVRIEAVYTGGGENFVVWVDNDLVVNTILGTRWPSTTYSGVHLVHGGVVQVEYSEGVRWSITQVY